MWRVAEVALCLASQGVLYAHEQIVEVFARCVKMTINANQEKYIFLTWIFLFLTKADSIFMKIRESQVSIYQM